MLTPRKEYPTRREPSSPHPPCAIVPLGSLYFPAVTLAQLCLPHPPGHPRPPTVTRTTIVSDERLSSASLFILLQKNCLALIRSLRKLTRALNATAAAAKGARRPRGSPPPC